MGRRGRPRNRPEAKREPLRSSFQPRRELILQSHAAGAGQCSFRVAQFNILAQSYAMRAYFPYTLHETLDSDARRARIVAELRRLDADVLCLQEVDEFVSQFRNIFIELGYSGVYKRRTGYKRDGSCILWKTDRFAPLLAVGIEMDELDGKMFQRRPDVESDFLVKNNVGVLVLLSPLSSAVHDFPGNALSSPFYLPSVPNVLGGAEIFGDVSNTERRVFDKSFFVGTAHVFWDPKFPILKMLQVQYVFRQLLDVCGRDQRVLELLTMIRGQSSQERRDHVAIDLKTAESNSLLLRLPVLFAGDLNSTPGSAVYNFLSGEPYVNAELIEMYNNISFLPPPSPCLTSAYSLTSSVLAPQEASQSGGRRGADSEPPYTTLVQNFSGTLDYIFVSERHFTVDYVLELPSHAECTIEGALPNSLHPSDHLSLLCGVSWKVSDSPT